MISLDAKALQRYRASKRAIFFNVLFNLSLALLKGSIGYIAHSRALIADAFHSAGDLVVNIVVLIGLRTAYKPADEEHPYGHGRAETIAQNMVGMLIVLTGGYLAVSSILSLGEAPIAPPGILALIAAFISLVVKEGLFRYLRRVGNKVNSKALLANACDHRSDVLSSLAVLIGVGGARLGGYLGYTGLYYLDPLAGAAVSVLIINMGLGVVRDAGKELMDSMCSPETVEEISATALSVPRVKEVYDVRGRSSGPCILVDLEIGVDKDLSVEEGHEVAHEVEDRLLYGREDIHFVVVHVAPSSIKRD